MKKIAFPIIALAFIFLQYSCSTKKFITVNQIISDYPIILVLARNSDMIATVRIPVAFRMSTRSFSKIKVGHTSYWHDSQFSNEHLGSGCTLYVSEKGVLSMDEERQKIGFIDKEFVVYTRHRSSYNKNDKFGLFLQPYAEQMKKHGKDTLHISSIQELKKTNPEIINAFLQGDSLLFRFHKGKSIFTRTFPVEIK